MATRIADRIRNFAKPDEIRPFEGRGRTEMVHLNGQTVSRATFEPGWRWSVNVRPIAGTDSCLAEHLGYCVSGRMRVRMDDGTTFDIGPGDVVHIPPGHDAETLGDERMVLIDFGNVSDYAKRDYARR